MADPDPNFPLLPTDSQLTPEQDLQAAVQGVLAVPGGVAPAAEAAPLPMGRTWQFDFETGRFIRRGGSPAETSGFGAIEQWCLMALHSQRFAHPVFSDEFGMEDPLGPLGELALGEVLADYERHLTDALLVHDRITSVENVALRFDATDGTLYIDNFDVVTDEDDRISITDLPVERSLP